MCKRDKPKPSSTVMATETEEGRRWYVLSANYRKEIAVRDELRALGFEVFVPMRYALTSCGGHRQRVLLPAIHELVFVRATKDEIFDYKHSSHNNPYVFFRSVRRGDTWQPIVVRDEDMRNFMHLNAIDGVELKYFKPEELHLAKGQRVKIMDGPFQNIVGMVQKLPHKHGDYLVVEIPGVTVAAVRIKPDFVQPVERKVAQSTNVDADVKRLDRLACRLLYELPDTPENAVAHGSVVNEMRILCQALEGSKTFMPKDRAAYALAHFLAALSLGESVDDSVAMLRAVVPKLRSVNLLRLRASMYLSIYCHDEAATTFADGVFSRLDIATCSTAHKKLMTEKRLAERRAGQLKIEMMQPAEHPHS